MCKKGMLHAVFVLACIIPASSMPSPFGGAEEVHRKPRINVVAMAERYYGMDERWHRKKLTELMGLDPVTTPWCAAFVNRMLEKVGIPGTGSAESDSFMRWGVATKEPKLGDVVVLNGHVGLFVAFNEDHRTIKVLGGNQGNKVEVRDYSLRSVKSFRTWPDASLMTEDDPALR